MSNADLKETLDILRIVVDARRLAAMTATNAITIKDTAERITAAGKIITALDKARPEVIIDVELLEVNRTRLKEYGLQIASPTTSPTGINGQADINREGLTLQDLSNLTSADVLLTNFPALYYRLLKTDSATRVLANPQLRTSEGVAAQARFGERVPVPVTTFAPIAAGGVQTQPITSFNYENIGVNIDITPRTHHDDAVSLAVRVELSAISGTGFGGLPTFGNRSISTVIRLKDGETNMLAGLIRDEERTSLSGIPGLSDIPVIGPLFAFNHKESQETDIILTLTPRIVRVLNLSDADLQAFRVGRDSGAPITDIPPLPVPLPVQPVRPPGRRAAGGSPAAGARRATGWTGRAGEAARAAQASWAARIHALNRGQAERNRRCPAPAGARRAGCTRAQRSRAARRGSALRRPAPPQSTPFPIECRGCPDSFPSAAWPGDDDAVGIAEKEVGAHAAHLFQRKQPQFVHPVVNQRRAVSLRCQHGHEADEVAWKAGPEPGGDAPSALKLDDSARNTSPSCTHWTFIFRSVDATTSMSTGRVPPISIAPPVIAPTTAQLPASM